MAMTESNVQPLVPELETRVKETETRPRSNKRKNQLDPLDRRFHDWYRFVLSFPPHLVRDYLTKFGLGRNHRVLDPFCGTGTTLVEAKLNGVEAIGIEANYFTHFASSIKLNWEIDVEALRFTYKSIASKVEEKLEAADIDDAIGITGKSNHGNLLSLPPDSLKLLIKNSISPLPLHKALLLLEEIDHYQDQAFHGHLRLALANALVFSISNLRFGPEVGVGKIKPDSPVLFPWKAEMKKICEDIESVIGLDYPKAQVLLGDSRASISEIPDNSIDAIITSPPYPNEKDYSRTTRLESVLLGFIEDKSELRSLKKTFLRSNTRGVYKADTDNNYVKDNQEIQTIVRNIENRRRELGKTSGFEKMYHRVTEEYFGGMARHLQEIQRVLRPGAKLAYVVGDQASYLQIMIRTGQLLANIAADLGYKVDRIDLFRTRFATATREELREEVIVLTWPG